MNNKRTFNTNRLDNYVRSYGTVIPKDFIFYQAPDGDKHALCVFCDRLHDHHPILRHDYANSDSAIVVAGVFTCDACAIVVERMEMRSMGDRPADVIESALKGLFGDVEAQNRERNVGNYVREGLFPPYVHLYYQHLRTEGDPLWATHRTHQCVFCDAKVEAYTSDTFMIEVPVGSDMYHLDGGLVLTCALCTSLIKDHIPEPHFEGWLSNTFVTKICPRCTSAYLVTKDEDEYQYMSKTNGQHSCPECTYINVNASTEGPFYYRAQETDGKLKRYMDSLCGFCQEYFGVDQTLSERYILSKHVTDSGQITCLECCYQTHQPISSLRVQDLVWIFYYNEKKGKAFAIKRTLTHPISEIKEFGSIAEMYAFFNRIEEVSNG